PPRPVPPAGRGVGHVFWHPRGFTLYRIIEDHIRRRMADAGFREIRTPQLMDRALWEASGRWEEFGGEMFVVPDGNPGYALKPMTCPGPIQVFNKRVRSFRDLPLRYCEFGARHRNEPSGALQGLARTTRLPAGRRAHLLRGPPCRGGGAPVQRATAA